MAKLHDIYRQEVIGKLTKQFGYKTVMQVPRIEKITLNMGVGEALTDKKILENAAADMAAISGQKPFRERTLLRRSMDRISSIRRRQWITASASDWRSAIPILTVPEDFVRVVGIGRSTVEQDGPVPPICIAVRASR